MKHLIDLRHSLHKHAELSGREKLTSNIIINFIKPHLPDQIISSVGGHGLIVVYNSGLDGPSVLFRAEMDALPINEENSFEYKSMYSGVSHKCGHDGHASILCGLSEFISANRPKVGKAILLFQPAEETGDGARLVLDDQKYIEADYAFALHNIPGFPLHSVILKENTFALASVGISISFKGISSHASQPELGVSPVKAVAEVIFEINKRINSGDESFCMLTITHVAIGEPAFGLSPADAKILVTLRGISNSIVDLKSNLISEFVRDISRKYNLSYTVEYSDRFPATVNDVDAVNILKSVAEYIECEIITPDKPFRWSEDFGYFTDVTKGALYGLGAGENHPPLHYSNYDFPDVLIQTGIRMMSNVYSEILLK